MGGGGGGGLGGNCAWPVGGEVSSWWKGGFRGGVSHGIIIRNAESFIKQKKYNSTQTVFTQ